MGVKRFDTLVYHDHRWTVLRLAVKRLDGFKCVKCGSRHRLEVDDILSVRDRRDLAFEITNLQTLCDPRHGRKTRIEAGYPELSPERQKWRDLPANMQDKTTSKIHEVKHA